MKNRFISIGHRLKLQVIDLDLSVIVLKLSIKDLEFNKRIGMLFFICRQITYKCSLGRSNSIEQSNGIEEKESLMT